MSARCHEHVPKTSERSRNPPAVKGGRRYMNTGRHSLRSFVRGSIGFHHKSLIKTFRNTRKHVTGRRTNRSELYSPNCTVFIEIFIRTLEDILILM